MGHVLGWTLSSEAIGALCEIFAVVEDTGTVLWQVFCHI